jgi:2-dehydro-3-deoxyglucarate aldolase/4-hydroxy-2-oxoheptanedioate aldolase
MMQILKNAGFDFVIIDNEHGAFGIESIADISRMARILGLTPIVRVPELAYPYIAQSLDVGSQGIMLPRVTHPDQVHQILEIMKYPPLGKRGTAMSRGQTDFRAGPLEENLAHANANSLLWVQIETTNALQHLDEIVTIAGVDALFIGPTDLSISLGIPGQNDSPILTNAIEHVLAACKAHGVGAAIQANDINYARRWVERGMDILSYSSEIGLLTAAASAGIQTIRAARTPLGDTPKVV